MKAVDSHCHLDFDQYDNDRESVISESKEKLEFLVNAGSSLDRNKKVIELHRKHPELVVPALGLHPTYTDHFNELEEIKNQIEEYMPAAVGEIGLDHHHVKDSKLRKKQREIFRELIQVAEEIERPVVVHSRNAEDEAVQILSDEETSGVMLHAFNGRPSLAEKAVEKGFRIGVTTQVLYSSRVQSIVEKIELEDLLLETDSPFLYQGERNHPENVFESAEMIAEIKEVGREQVIEETTRSARELFRND
ncbi:MAG: TatD family hydrolase [Candidatus Nanohaloarchaea archaeon]